jgi:arylsulfatase A-like enzyme
MSGGSALAAAETTLGALKPATHGAAATANCRTCRRERRVWSCEAARASAWVRPRLTGARALAHPGRLERRDAGRGAARGGRAAVALLVLLTAALGCTRSAERSFDPPGRTTDGRPHVVVYCIDTLRADHLGAYGYERATSPSIDAVAAEGIVFENAVSQAPWTLPSVTSYLTSTFPTTHGVLKMGRGLPDHLQTMAETMHGAGYQTVGFVQNAFAGSASGADRGFEVFYDRLRPKDADGKVDRHSVGELIEWLGRRESRQPLFLYVHTVEPHWPNYTPRRLGPFGKWTEEQKAELDELFKRFRKLRRGPATETNEAKDRRIAELRTVHAEIEKRTPMAIDQYDNGVHRADENFGRIVEALKGGGYWGDTILVLIADHGEELGEHGYWQHDQSLHRELIHVPLVVRFPEGPGGRRVASPVQLIDVLPTLAELVGAPRHATWEGRSFLELARRDPADGDGAPAERIAVSERINLGRDDPLLKSGRGDVEVAFVARDWKAILQAERDELLLYDALRDPRETQDLAPTHDADATRWKREAEEWLAARRPEADETDDHRLSGRAVESLKALGYIQ